MATTEGRDRPAEAPSPALPVGAAEHQIQIVRSILQGMIGLAKPDDLAFLEIRFLVLHV